MHNLRNILLGFVAVLLANMAAAAPLDPTDANWHVTLERFWGTVDRRGQTQDRNLECFINLVNGEMASGLAYAPLYNKSGHRIDKAIVKTRGEDFEVSLEVTIYPDRWVPKDGRVRRFGGQLTGKLRPGADGAVELSGTYGFLRDGEKIKGRVSGSIVPRATVTDQRLAARLSATKIDGRDFPEMELELALVAGKPAWGRFGMSWNRWPHRWCPMPTTGLTWNPKQQRLTGTAMVPARAVDVGAPPKTDCSFTLDGAYIGSVFTVRVTTQLTSERARERTFNGGQRVELGPAGPEPNPKEYAWMYAVDQQPWFTPVKGHVSVASGEHPRLLFRANQLEDIRARARTPEGAAIVDRLRRLLGNDGKKLPDKFNTVAPHNHNKSDTKVPVGIMFTSFHAPGYAMLYALTNETMYAKLAHDAVELMFKGAIDRDNRYAWTAPGTLMRAGSLLWSVALTYDLAYHGWEEAFRRKVALALQDYNQPVAAGDRRVNVRLLMGRTGYPPASNHYGSHFGGTLLAMLAILGDPGTNTSLVTERITEGTEMIPHMLSHGFGDAGWYQEGPHPSRLSTNGGFVPMLPAIRNVLGHDYITPRREAQWMTLRWILWLSHDREDRPVFLNRGTYGDDRFYGRAPMLSHSADFALGFGAVDKKYTPALLWTYLNCVECWERNDRSCPTWVEPGERSFNSFVYPIHAVHALVNWPIGIEPVNPAKVLSRHVVDHTHDYFVSRNRWKDGDDIIVTFSTGGGPWGYHRPQSRGSVHLRAFGGKFTLPLQFGHFRPTFHRSEKDGSFSLGLRSNFGELRRGALAVDLSGASGVPLVVLAYAEKEDVEKIRKRLESSRKRRKTSDTAAFQSTMVTGGAKPIYVSTIDRSTTPHVTANGNQVTVGAKTYTLETSERGAIIFEF